MNTCIQQLYLQSNGKVVRKVWSKEEIGFLLGKARLTRLLSQFDYMQRGDQLAILKCLARKRDQEMILKFGERSRVRVDVLLKQSPIFEDLDSTANFFSI